MNTRLAGGYRIFFDMFDEFDDIDIVFIEAETISEAIEIFNEKICDEKVIKKVEHYIGNLGILK